MVSKLLREYMNRLNEANLDAQDFPTNYETAKRICQDVLKFDDPPPSGGVPVKYTVHPDGTVDVKRNVTLTNFHRIPVRFGKVGGDFNMVYMSGFIHGTKSLIGMPKEIGANFRTVGPQAELSPTTYIEILGSKIGGVIFTNSPNINDILNQRWTSSRDKLNIIRKLRELEATRDW